MSFPLRTARGFCWYTLAGSFATALGALCGGAASESSRKGIVFRVRTATAQWSFLYAALGMALAFLFLRSLVLDGSESVRKRLDGEEASRRRTFASRSSSRLSSLFALDSFAGGFRGAKLCRVLVLFALRESNL